MRKLLIVLTLCGVSILNAQQLNVASYNVRNSNPNDAKAGNGWEQRCSMSWIVESDEQLSITTVSTGCTDSRRLPRQRSIQRSKL